jgi:hypothetical protein
MQQCDPCTEGILDAIIVGVARLLEWQAQQQNIPLTCGLTGCAIIFMTSLISRWETFMGTRLT